MGRENAIVTLLGAGRRLAEEELPKSTGGGQNSASRFFGGSSPLMAEFGHCPLQRPIRGACRHVPELEKTRGGICCKTSANRNLT